MRVLLCPTCFQAVNGSCAAILRHVMNGHRVELAKGRFQTALVSGGKPDD